MSRSTLDSALSSWFSLTGLSPSMAGLSRAVLLTSKNHKCGPNPDVHAHRFGLFRFRSPLLPESHVVFSSSGYLDVSVHRVPSAYLWIQYAVTEVCSARFPHSEICGSMDICSSPQLIAAYHVFRRLSVPRHPPCALFCLTSDKAFYALSHLLSIALPADGDFFFLTLQLFRIGDEIESIIFLLFTRIARHTFTRNASVSRSCLSSYNVCPMLPAVSKLPSVTIVHPLQSS